MRWALVFLAFLCVPGLTMAQERSDPPLSNYAEIEGGTLACKMKPNEATKLGRKFFVKWLSDHGEKHIVDDETGVGIQGKPTRFWAFRYLDSDGNKTSEMEFRVVLPDGREIQEFVSSLGMKSGVVEGALANFALSTFHTVYSCLLNEADPHMEHEPITIGGRKFLWTSAGMMHVVFRKKDSPAESPDFDGMVDQIRKLMEDSNTQLSKQIHWFKFVYGEKGGKSIMASVTQDNEGHDGLSSKLGELEWPDTEHTYIAKQFVMLRPVE